MLTGLKNRTALVTGATSGIGAAVAQRLYAEHVKVFRTDVNPGDGIIVADLTDSSEVEKLAGQVGAIDLLINVAGGPVPASRDDPLPALPAGSVGLQDIDDERWARVLAVNLTTAFLLCRELAPGMQARRFGRIINFSSIAARRGSDRVGVHYAAAKGGIMGLTKTLALELAPHNITVNAIAPGFISTERIEQAGWGRQSEEKHRAFLESIPLKRAGTPEDIAGVVAMLCSDAGGYVSGATVDVNGGLYFGP